MPKEEGSNACSKEMYEYNERIDEVTGNEEIRQVNTEIVENEYIAFCPRTCSGQLLFFFFKSSNIGTKNVSKERLIQL